MKRNADQSELKGGKDQRHRFLPVLVIVLMLVIIVWGGLRTIAAWHFHSAQSAMADMIDTGKITRAGIDSTNAHNTQALKYFPQNPDYLDLAGQLRELQADRPGVVGRERREHLEAAADYYRNALSVRPLWPYSWANLLAVKDAMGVADDEFLLAMNRSNETGPWEPRVQLQVVRSGLRHWETLGTLERQMVRDVVAKALKKQPREIFELVRSFSRADLVCSEATINPAIVRWCETAIPLD